MPSNVDAYQKGYEAAQAGQSLSDNPYVADNAGHWHGKWRQGFTDASKNAPRRLKPRRFDLKEMIQP
jgi:ribosome modulation factor